MRRRETMAGLFVVVMLGLGGAIVMHWKSQQPKYDFQVPAPIDWHPATVEQFQAAKAIVGGQLSAFHTDNFQMATAYQSQLLKLNFYTVSNFRSVITNRYPEFCHFESVQFGRCSSDPDGDRLRIEITLISKKGDLTRAAYFLHREDGGYRVAQVLTGDYDPRFLHRPGDVHFAPGPAILPPGALPGGSYHPNGSFRPGSGMGFPMDHGGSPPPFMGHAFGGETPDPTMRRTAKVTAHDDKVSPGVRAAQAARQSSGGVSARSSDERLAEQPTP